MCHNLCYFLTSQNVHSSIALSLANMFSLFVYLFLGIIIYCFHRFIEAEKNVRHATNVRLIAAHCIQTFIILAFRDAHRERHAPEHWVMQWEMKIRVLFYQLENSCALHAVSFLLIIFELRFILLYRF